MCCRYYINRTPETEQLIDLINRRSVRPDTMKEEGEIFPGDTVPVIASDRQKHPSAFAMKWGFRLEKKLLPNARSETAAIKPMFSEGFRLHRCAIPAAWYYEWNAEKQKFAISPADGQLYLAGIYRMEDRPVFTVLTREPGASTAMIHPRMPVILPQELVREWIQPDVRPELILPQAMTEMQISIADL